MLWWISGIRCRYIIYLRIRPMQGRGGFHFCSLLFYARPWRRRSHRRHVMREH